MTTDWQGPPEDVLGAVVPLQRLAAQADRAVIALQHAVVFRTGCLLVLDVAVRRGSLDQAAWNEAIKGTFRPEDPGAGLEAGLRFGVRFPDGSRATTVGHSLAGWAPATDRPEPPMLVEGNSTSGGGDAAYRSSRELWLWPLPPAAPFEFVVEWPSLGVERTSVELDGGALARAAETVLPYWPPEPES